MKFPELRHLLLTLLVDLLAQIQLELAWEMSLFHVPWKIKNNVKLFTIFHNEKLTQFFLRSETKGSRFESSC